MKPQSKLNARAWLSLELLMTTALCVLVGGAGMIAMFQVIGSGNALYPTNQLQQMELSRMLLEIEGDFYGASRVYVWNSKITENGGDLSSGTHLVSEAAGDYEAWPLIIPADDEVTFLDYWTTWDPNIWYTDSDSTHKYYTLVFLGGGQNIRAVVYLDCTQTASGVTYTMTRYENNGAPPSFTDGRLVQTNSFTYTAPGVTFTTSDQSATGTTFPSITKSGSIYSAFVIRFPTAFSKALRDQTTGKQARRVKYTADAWSTWTFVPGEAGRWVKQ